MEEVVPVVPELVEVWSAGRSLVEVELEGVVLGASAWDVALAPEVVPETLDVVPVPVSFPVVVVVPR